MTERKIARIRGLFFVPPLGIPQMSKIIYACL